MKARFQRGVAMLSVSILLVILGALAFVMSRQGAMAARRVAMQYDTEVARYLAEAGVSVARWRSQRASCSGNTAPLQTITLANGGRFSATLAGGKDQDITAVGTSPQGAQVTVRRNNLRAHSATVQSLVMGTATDHDTYVNDLDQVSHNNSLFTELTNGHENGFLLFSIPGALSRAQIVKADLNLVHYQSNSTQAGMVSVRRATADWTESAATWTIARSGINWTRPGGDFTTGVVAQTMIAPNPPAPVTYSWEVTSLLDGWVNNTLPQFGLALVADGPLQQARFYGFQGGANMPVIRVTYYPSC